MGGDVERRGAEKQLAGDRDSNESDFFSVVPLCASVDVNRVYISEHK